MRKQHQIRELVMLAHVLSKG